MLGKDVNRHEYWFFKEEPTKIFVKYIEKREVQNDGLMEVDDGQMDVQYEEKIQWLYYDEEDEL